MIVPAGAATRAGSPVLAALAALFLLAAGLAGAVAASAVGHPVTGAAVVVGAFVAAVSAEGRLGDNDAAQARRARATLASGGAGYR